ncbi:IS4 family transposase [Nocardia sp. 2TAF39]|uniref:IS4 family transposase n=1 Tax=Nocardia sp. 2TAF39 TaxID=3233017 RepID=UPI003F9EB2B4
MPRGGWVKPESDRRLSDLVSVGLLTRVFPADVVDDVLGYEPVRDLFFRVARPVAGVETPGSWLAGRRVVAIDGTCVDLADTVANAEFFGRPPSSRGEKSAYPQARLVAVAECGTHAIFDAVTGPCTTSETEMAHKLVSRLVPGMLVLADRGFYGFTLWKQAAATGADLLWRVKTNLRPQHMQTLADGSWLARIVPTSGPNRRKTTPLTVRVIDYTLDDGRDNPEQYRLLTTILDPDQASATELALAYAQRWEIENTFDELKTHQRGPRAVLRSKSPDLVQQEIWGHLCCHYAIRTLMLDTATHGGHDPDRISFAAALRITRRSLSHSTFPPL